MCLNTKKRFDTFKEAQAYKGEIATKDIVVYKVLDRASKTYGQAPYQSDFYYEKGIQYTESKLKIEVKRSFNDEYCLQIHQGLHAFVYKTCKGIKEYMYLHKQDCKSKAIKMTIPKGSIYYLGTNGDIVTNNLIWY